MKHIPHLLILIALAPLARAADAPNLLLNPGFEEIKGDFPADWEKTVIGVAPEFSIDRANPHGGKDAACINSAEVTRSYFTSAPIAVSPGEKINASAWVSCKDVPPAMGTVILIAQFAREDGSNTSVEKVNTADVTKAGWQQIKGSVNVPEDVAHLRLRAGFSYAKGICCWDDLTVTAVEPVVARVNLHAGKLSPALESIPVTILNRTQQRIPLRVQVTLGDKPFSSDVKLDGKPVQTVNVAVAIEKRGKTKLQLALFHQNDKEPFLTQDLAFIVPPPIVLDPPSPTHWVVEDGQPQIEGEVVLALKSATSKSAKLTVKVLDDANQPRATWSSEDLKDGPNAYRIQAPGLAPGKYRIEASVQPASGQALRAEQNWAIIPRSKARVTINSAGYCVYDGKQIFPLGIFNSGKPEELAEAGFTVTHAYNATRVFIGNRPLDQNALEFLDSSEKLGLKTLFMVPLAFATHGDWDGFRRRIRMFRNHPGLLAWDEEEGLARGDWNMEILTKVRQILKEEDPNHPFMVGDGRDVVFRIKDRANFFPVDQMDLGMWWWYPIPMKAGKHLDALEGEEVSGLELTPPTFLTQAKTNKPIWVAVQSYKKKDGRFPNPIEYRAQPYIAIAEGAKGVMWYGGYVTGGMFQFDNKTEAHWPELKKIVTELNSLQEVFMAPSAEKPTISPEKAPISVALKRAPNRLVLIAVNRGEKPLDVQFNSPLIKSGDSKVISEARSISTTSGQLKDRFDLYATHVYELP